MQQPEEKKSINWARGLWELFLEVLYWIAEAFVWLLGRVVALLRGIANLFS